MVKASAVTLLNAHTVSDFLLLSETLSVVHFFSLLSLLAKKRFVCNTDMLAANRPRTYLNKTRIPPASFSLGRPSTGAHFVPQIEWFVPHNLKNGNTELVAAVSFLCSNFWQPGAKSLVCRNSLVPGRKDSEWRSLSIHQLVLQM